MEQTIKNNNVPGSIRGPVGYLGPEGTFSEEAAQAFFSADVLLLPHGSIAAVYEAFNQRTIEAAVLPMENSIEGAVNQTLDELIEHPGLFIIGEVILAIRHHLLVRDAVDWRTIKAVYSHPQALAQCRKFLEGQMPAVELVATESTAEGARKVALAGEPQEPKGAIASQFAAQRYGLVTGLADVQDRANNKTRFVVIGRQLTEPTGCDKTSLVFALPQDRPGGLYAILKEFADRQINLTRIESRPTKQELGQYLFFIDCVGHHRDPMVAEALNAIGKFTVLTRVLGSYVQG